MEINPVNIDPIKRQTDIRFEPAAKPPPRKETPELGQQDLEAPVHEHLMTELKNMPDVRPDVVELGKKLASDPGYPSEEVLDKLAEILVDLPVVR